ncbi:hypothetical protein [Nonomuraea salmonea]|uniref:hypothetical protein n=1 Tax=Nonomuraea salmonea TaxID=46181 RepID=UPI0031E92947
MSSERTNTARAWLWGAARAAGLVLGVVEHLPVDGERDAADLQLDRLARDALPVAYGLGDHVGHPRVALDRGHLGAVAPGGGDAGVELADRGQQHVGLAERGQHLLDVAQEGEVGAEDEHAAPLEALAVGVEQVRGPVQGHDGLAGARSALHHQHPVEVAADDAVLLGLDGGDDVAHASRAPLVEGGEQRGLAVERGAVVVGERVEVEQVVVHADDVAAPGLQVAAAGDAHGGAVGVAR